MQRTAKKVTMRAGDSSPIGIASPFISGLNHFINTRIKEMLQP